MDAFVVSFYRRIYADGTIDSEEAAELKDFLSNLNPPPDKILWMRATAFRIGCECLKAGDRDTNLSLLKTMNCLVHAIETNCLQPKDMEQESEVDSDALCEFYRTVFTDRVVEEEESDDLKTYFETHVPAPSFLAKVRFLAFKVASEFLSSSDDDSTTDEDVKLLKCLNAVVHAFEITSLQPKPLVLKQEEAAPRGVDLSSLSLSDAVQHLWNLDANRLDPSRDYSINVQGGKKPYWKDDKAEDPLFSYVDPKILRQRPTYQTFVALLDNYSPFTGEQESFTRAEQAEINRFLGAVMQTKPMQFCHQYCVAHADQSEHDIPSDTDGFQALLYRLWFELYRRETSRDSSGFEHVFVGEIRDNKISGFHNWIQFYLQERQGHVDYRGYIKPKSREDARPDDYDHLLTLQFTWHGVTKSVGSSFIGVSPEFEFALYTMCFLVGQQHNVVQLATGSVEQDTYELDIVCYTMARGKIGTSYPEIKSHYEEE